MREPFSIEKALPLEGEGTIWYALKDPAGPAVTLSSYGAAVTRVELPCADSRRRNVCMGLCAQDYPGNPFYAGATIAPVAGRISGAAFEEGGKLYKVAANEGGSTCLHGGPNGGHSKIWETANQKAASDFAEIEFQTELPDGLGGFCGNRVFTARYRLEAGGRLRIFYTAVTDAPTPVSMTNHMYFNFSGNFEQDVLSHQIEVAAPCYLRNDLVTNLPIDLVPVQGTPYDLQKPVTFREAFAAAEGFPGIRAVNGFDNAFDVRGAAAQSKALLTLKDPETGRGMRVFSKTAQCAVLYTGGSVQSGTPLADGAHACPSCAVAVELQAFPDAVNHPAWGSCILRPGEVYHHEICYEFTGCSQPREEE